jgi:SAM-dependent methyltransferase
MRFMGEDDERFLSEADKLARILIERGLRPDSALLDIGSGYGRLAFGLMRQLDFVGRYEGFDLLPKQIKWSTEAITSRSPNFHFALLDVANARYNRQGSIEAGAMTFPYDEESFDMCALFSVFTHMYEVEVRRYMGEIRRVIKESGSCVATFFLFDEDRLEAILSDDSALPMRHQLNETTRYFSQEDILHAIAYEQRHMRQMWEMADMQVTGIEWGTWAGDQGDGAGRNGQDPPPYQDVVTIKCAR